MKTIWKWNIAVTDRQTVNIPEGGEILDVQVQGASMCIWVLVNPDAQAKPRTLYVYGTGHTLPDYPGRYVGTFQIAKGSLVFHLFEETTVAS
jgi:hypothetical protein